MNIPVETLLLERGLLTERQLRRAMEFRERCPDKALEEILLDFGYVSEAALLACLGERDGLEVVDLSEYKVDPEASGLISRNFSDQYQVLPIGIRNGKLVVAARDPLMFDVFDEIEAAAGMELTVVLAAAESIRNCAAAVYREQDLSNAVQKVNKEVLGSGYSREVSAASERVEGTPIVKMVNTLIEQAYARGASDIHVEPMEDRLVIRLRVNGDLVEHASMAMEAHRPIVTRLKIMGGMDIAEKRLPQDGKYRYDRGQVKTDLRISALPTIYGEKIVLRLLNSARDDCLMDVRRLGMTEEQEEIFERFIKAPYGLVLVTGPTGSGKTTTLLKTVEQLKDRLRIGIMEADIDSAVDAQIMAGTGVRTIQLHTGGMCHLDAGMTEQGLKELGTDDLDLAILENVGNLVCPAEFDTGAVKNAMILSVPEGHDKPLKYPLIFTVCDVLLINKIDVLPYFDFDMEKVIESAHMRNPALKIFPVSAKTGEGIEAWTEWLYQAVAEWKGEN